MWGNESIEHNSIWIRSFHKWFSHQFIYVLANNKSYIYERFREKENWTSDEAENILKWIYWIISQQSFSRSPWRIESEKTSRFLGETRARRKLS